MVVSIGIGHSASGPDLRESVPIDPMVDLLATVSQMSVRYDNRSPQRGITLCEVCHLPILLLHIYLEIYLSSKFIWGGERGLQSLNSEFWWETIANSEQISQQKRVQQLDVQARLWS